MTDYQRKRITLMRKQNVGYATIAKELRLSLGAVKQFCRRNDLQSDDLETDTQHENYAEPPLENDLISVESRGNSTTAKRPRALEKTGVPGGQPVCDVTVSYADEPDKAAVADVLTILTNAHFGR